MPFFIVILAFLSFVFQQVHFPGDPLLKRISEMIDGTLNTTNVFNIDTTDLYKLEKAKLYYLEPIL